MPGNPSLFLELVENTASPTLRATLAGAGTAKYILPKGFTPVISGRRLAEVNGRGPIEQAVEEIEVNVVGASASECYANLETLSRLLDQATRWDAGENVNAVLLRFCPKGATVSSPANPLYATVYGRAKGDRSTGVGLSPKFSEAGQYYVIEGVRLRLVRLGTWLHTTETNTSGSSATANPVKATLGFANNPAWPGPTRLELALTNIRDTKMHAGYIVLARAAADVAVLDRNTTAQPDMAAVADAAALSTGGSVIRFTPTVTTYREFNDLYPGAHFRRALFLVSVRPSSTARTWTLRPKVGSGGVSAAYWVYGKETVFTPTSTNPTILNLGEVVSEDYSYPNATIEIKVDSTSGSPYLDVDVVVILDTSKPENQAFVVSETAEPGSSSTPRTYLLDPRLATHPRAFVGLDAGGAGTELLAQGYSGDAYPHLSGNALALVYFATRDTYWCVPNTTLAAAGTITPTARRTLAYVSPQ